MKKVPKSRSPHPKKNPKIDPVLRPSLGDNPVWQVGSLDNKGPWGWENIDKTKFFTQILPKIKDFETMMWSDILNRNNHEVYVSSISRAAQKRLAEIKLDDFDRLVSLRFSGKERLWGIKINNVFKLIWWDPNHEVYPSKLKHT